MKKKRIRILLTVVMALGLLSLVFPSFHSAPGAYSTPQTVTPVAGYTVGNTSVLGEQHQDQQRYHLRKARAAKQNANKLRAVVK